MPSYAITGASRGIGFALLKQLSADSSNQVFAIVRSPDPFKEKLSQELPDRKNIHVVYGDLDDFASLRASADAVSSITKGSLDVLIPNAAYLTADFDAINAPDKNWDEFDESALHSFRANVLGNIHLMSAFTPLLLRGSVKKVLAISSGMGDQDLIAGAGIQSQSAYSISKAALNLAIAKFHAQYKADGLLFMAISPGVVDTGGLKQEKLSHPGMQAMMASFLVYQPNFKGPITPEESARLVLGVLQEATIEKNGGIMVSHLGSKQWL